MGIDNNRILKLTYLIASIVTTILILTIIAYNLILTSYYFEWFSKESLHLSFGILVFTLTLVGGVYLLVSTFLTRKHEELDKKIKRFFNNTNFGFFTIITTLYLARSSFNILLFSDYPTTTLKVFVIFFIIISYYLLISSTFETLKFFKK